MTNPIKKNIMTTNTKHKNNEMCTNNLNVLVCLVKKIIKIKTKNKYANKQDNKKVKKTYKYN
jgi:hypothetical protein